MKGTIRSTFGTTLVELLVALGIFSVSMLGILSITPQMYHGIALSRQYQSAVLLAENQMELLRAGNLSQSADQGPLPLWPEAGSTERLPVCRGQYQVVKAPAGYELKVSILWTSTGGEQSYELQTLISDRIK